MSRFWIYVHTCPNGKRYVGTTTRENPEWRWCFGKGYCWNKHFHSAILKYGWNNIAHEFWELTSESEMYYAEKYLIAYYQTTNPEYGYNNSIGGKKHSLGCHYSLSPETKAKVAEANRRKAKDPDYRRRLSEIQKGKPKPGSRYERTPEHRKRMSEACKGKKHVRRVKP